MLVRLSRKGLCQQRPETPAGHRVSGSALADGQERGFLLFPFFFLIKLIYSRRSNEELQRAFISGNLLPWPVPIACPPPESGFLLFELAELQRSSVLFLPSPHAPSSDSSGSRRPAVSPSVPGAVRSHQACMVIGGNNLGHSRLCWNILGHVLSRPCLAFLFFPILSVCCCRGCYYCRPSVQLLSYVLLNGGSFSQISF